MSSNRSLRPEVRIPLLSLPAAGRVQHKHEEQSTCGLAECYGLPMCDRCAHQLREDKADALRVIAAAERELGVKSCGWYLLDQQDLAAVLKRLAAPQVSP